MTRIGAGSAGYYCPREALKAADQLIELLQQEHARGFFQLEDVVLRSEDTDFVFTGAEYMEFARRGLRDALARPYAAENESGS